MSALKVLTVGSAVGSISDLFSKIKALDAKHGKFDFALCVGDFFGPVQGDSDDAMNEILLLLDGKLEAPLDCYIMQGEYPLPQKVVERFAATGGELCNRVFLMSKSGIVSKSNGLRIACLGGVYDPDVYSSAEAPPGFFSPYFSHHTVDKLLANTLSKSTAGPQQNSYNSLAAIQASSSPSQLVDILVSNVWPGSVTDFSNAPLPDSQLSHIGVQPLEEIVRKIKPRYHFAAVGGNPPKYWEREPYTWDDQQGRVSRFVSLGAYGGQPAAAKKQRWFYAFNIAPETGMKEPPPKPSNSTRNPFAETLPRRAKRPLDDGPQNFIFGNDIQQPVKRSRVAPQGQSGKPPPGYKCRRCDSSEHFINDCPERSKPPDSYVCKICGEPGHFVRDCPTRDAKGDTGGKKPKPGYVCRACGSEEHYLEDCLVANQRPAEGERRGGRRGPPKEIAPDECWFCLSNPNLAKHLIVAIGTECYVTLPKGQIIPTQSVANHADVPGGGHVLIVPITHFPTYSTIPQDLAPPINEETEQFKSALKEMYAKHRSAMVTIEVGRLSAKGGHAHVQVVPIPMSLKDKVEAAFIDHGRQQGIDFEEDAEGAMTSCANGCGSYFKVELSDGRTMVHLLKDHTPFSIQFGRQVLVSLLGMPERFDWKACILTEEEDRADAEAFKKAFAAFNPAA